MSARLTAEDAAFLERLPIDGASSASDKIRALIDERRRHSAGNQDYDAALRLTADLTAAARRRLLETEQRTGSHSAAVAQISDWLVECFAFYMSHAPDAHAGPEDPAELTALEDGLVDRASRLMALVARLAMTETAPCYNPHVITSRIAPTLALLDDVSARRRPPDEPGA